jgi:hypothetical protein
MPLHSHAATLKDSLIKLVDGAGGITGLLELNKTEAESKTLVSAL